MQLGRLARGGRLLEELSLDNTTTSRGRITNEKKICEASVLSQFNTYSFLTHFSIPLSKQSESKKEAFKASHFVFMKGNWVMYEASVPERILWWDVSLSFFFEKIPRQSDSPLQKLFSSLKLIFYWQLGTYYSLVILNCSIFWQQTFFSTTKLDFWYFYLYFVKLTYWHLNIVTEPTVCR